MEVFRFALLGCGAGAIYGLLAVGLVIIYRGSGVINFAQGAIGMAGTFTFLWLWRDEHLPWGLSLVLGAAASGILATLTHVLVMRPLRNSPPITRLIATLGVLALIEESIAHYYTNEPQIVRSELPTRPVNIFGVAIGENLLWLFAIAIATTAVLYLVYRYTGFGRQTTAGEENPVAAAAVGISPGVIAAINWAIGGILAGIAGILIAPIDNVSITQYTLFVLPALAAAILGGLRSFPLAMIGGLAIGIIQSWMTLYVSTPGWSTAAPFFLVVAVLLIRPSNLRIRSQGSVRLPRIGTGRINWRMVVPIFIAAIVLVQFVSAEWADATITTAGIGLIVLSLVLVTGYSGQLSLAQFAFAGFGAWIAGRLAATTGMPFLAAIAIGTVAALPLGLILGALVLRTRGANLAIATLGLAVALESIIFDGLTFTGGVNGTIIKPASIFGLDVDGVNFPGRYAAVCIVFFTLGALAVANLRRGMSGRRLLSVRANERAAESLGIGVRSAKLAAFGIAGMLAAMGGVLIAFQYPSIDYTQFDSLSSITIVGDAVLGGIGWVASGVLGGSFYVGSYGTAILNLFGSDVAAWLPVIGAVLLIINLILAPDGLAYMQWVANGQIRRVLHIPRQPAARTTVPDSTARQKVAPATLRVERLQVHFGGVRALDGVSLTVTSGEVVGLIGPNGAGKTTLLDAVTGFVNVTAGAVLLDDRNMAKMSAVKRARLGLARSFQSLELFDDMTVLDNLRAASEDRSAVTFATDLVKPRQSALSAATVAAIREFGLQDYLDSAPSELPYGLRRLVAIARAVANEPSVLLLDEPAAGLDGQQREELGSLIGRLARDWGMGVLLVEHDVEMVMSVSDRVYVIDFGHDVANGTPLEVASHPAVKAVYLGDEPDTSPLPR